MTTDLGLEHAIASLDANCAKVLTASWPHAPYVSTTKGMHTQPNSTHLASLLLCFLISEAWAATPEDTPASERISEFSGEVTQKSKAAGLPSDQFWTRTSAGLLWSWSGVKLLPTSSLTGRWARRQESANTSLSRLWRWTASPPRYRIWAECTTRATWCV